MGNGTWVCFDCKEAVRRPTHHAADVPCPACGESCKYIGTKIPIPAKRNTRAWQALRKRLTQWRITSQDQAQVDSVRQRHRLERAIASLEAEPRNAGRLDAIRLLKRQLDQL